MNVENTRAMTDKQTECRRCRGTRVVRLNGKDMTCPTCRGTGKSGQYQTK